MIQFPVSQCESTFSVQSSENMSSQNSTPSSGRNNIHDTYGIQINVNKLNKSSGKTPLTRGLLNQEQKTQGKGPLTEVTADEQSVTNRKFKQHVDNSQVSKVSSKLVLPAQDFKHWKKQTLERFLFHLKKIQENNNLNYLNIQN